MINTFRVELSKVAVAEDVFNTVEERAKEDSSFWCVSSLTNMV
jgi:hypothetical protein